MAGKSRQSLVPRMTSWRLLRNCLRTRHLTLGRSIGSDLLRKDEEDMVWAFLIKCGPSLLLNPFTSPFSKFHTSCESIDSGFLFFFLLLFFFFPYGSGKLVRGSKCDLFSFSVHYGRLGRRLYIYRTRLVSESRQFPGIFTRCTLSSMRLTHTWDLMHGEIT